MLNVTFQTILNTTAKSAKRLVVTVIVTTCVHKYRPLCKIVWEGVRLPTGKGLGRLTSLSSSERILKIRQEFTKL